MAMKKGAKNGLWANINARKKASSAARLKARSSMEEPADDLDIIEHFTTGNDLRLMPHPDEGHVHPDPELKALLEEVKLRQPQAAANSNNDPNTTDAA